MICLEEKHTCNLSPPFCCWHISYSRTMGRRKDERQMLHLSLGHSLVKQWSLQSPGLSNILSTNGIIPSQVLCLTLHLDETPLTGSPFDSPVSCYTVRQNWWTPGIKRKREEKQHPHFSSFLFLQYLYSALLSCAHSALHFTFQMDISLHHSLTWIQPVGLQSRNKINCSKF